MELVRGNIGILTTGTVPDYFFDSMMAMDLPRGTLFLRVAGARTDEGRNQLVDRMLKDHPSSQWILFCDSDMVFPRRTLMRLLSWKKPIVGGLYFLKAQTFEPVAYRFNAEATEKRRQELEEKGEDPIGYLYTPIVDLVGEFFFENQEYLPIPPKRGNMIVPPDEAGRKRVRPLQEVDGIGTGCLLIHREVFEELRRPFFSYREGGTEDFYFCRRAKEAGYRIFVDMGLICGHMGLQEVSYAHFANHFALTRAREDVHA